MNQCAEPLVDLGIAAGRDLEAPAGRAADPIQFSRTPTTARPRAPRAQPRRANGWQRSLPARRLLADVAVLGLIALLAFALWPARLGGATTYVIVKGTSMEPKFHTGDLAVVRTQDRYNVGDIVAYRIPKGTAGAGQMVIHRIIGHRHGGYLLQGDNRTTPDTWNPTNREIVGRYRMLIPLPGAGAWMLMPWVFCASIGISVMWILWPRKVVEDAAARTGGSDQDPDDSDSLAGPLSDPSSGPVTPVVVGQRRLRRLEREAAEAARRAERRARRRAHRRTTTVLGSLAVVIVAVAVTVFG